MNAKHTPGPWEVEYGEDQIGSNIQYWQLSDGQDAIACNQFCYAGYKPETNLANARLIAAAPELLELACQYRDDLRRAPSPESIERRLARIADIIAKATGAA